MRVGTKIALVLCALTPVLAGVACSSSSSSGGSDDGGNDALGSDANPSGEDGGDSTTTPPGDAGPDHVGSEAATGSDADAGSTDAPHDSLTSADADGGTSQDAADAGSTDAPPADAPADAPLESATGPDASDGGPCNSVTNSAPIVVTTSDSTITSPPAATGGTIPDGTYYVTSEVVYPSIDAGSGGPGLQSTQETAVISGSTVQVVIAMGPYPSDGGAGSVGAPQYLTENFSTSGTTLTITVPCGGGGFTGGAFPYSVNMSDAGVTTLSALITNTLFTLTKQ